MARAADPTPSAQPVKGVWAEVGAVTQSKSRMVTKGVRKTSRMMPQPMRLTGKYVSSHTGKSCGAGGLTRCDAGRHKRPNSLKETLSDAHGQENALFSKPTPAELNSPINPERGVEGHRNLFCGNYDSCLDEAVKRSWNSWTCTRCTLFAIQPQIESSIENYATQRRMA
jgi:hypothetical protein